MILGIANDIVVARKIGTRTLEGVANVLPLRLMARKDAKTTRGSMSNVASTVEDMFNNLNRLVLCCFTGQTTSEPVNEADKGTVKVVVHANTILLYIFHKIPR